MYVAVSYHSAGARARVDGVAYGSVAAAAACTLAAGQIATRGSAPKSMNSRTMTVDTALRSEYHCIYFEIVALAVPRAVRGWASAVQHCSGYAS
jgi:hypothetical protein